MQCITYVQQHISGFDQARALRVSERRCSKRPNNPYIAQSSDCFFQVRFDEVGKLAKAFTARRN